MRRIFEVMLVGAAWTIVSACEPPPNPAAQGAPRNESTAASDQRDTMEPLGQERTGTRRDLASEFGGDAGQAATDFGTTEPAEQGTPGEREGY